MRKIELLSPAKTAEHGIVAISHGADAIYIGAPQFSARASAGNDIKSIEQLINYAHLYHAKVYVALNTILTDKELLEAEKLINLLYNIGTDALIIQDFGITQLSLPPIALHASTQMDNRTPDKVKFLEDAGFEQVVLARELSLNEITNIAQNCSVKLEAFVHGALCVSYSGRCYLSQHICQRSANRGRCAQLCRLPYSLIDANGNYIAKNSHLLSLKDMNRSNYIKEMIQAGISSLKIEGRLKDISYVKNVTAYYRKILDTLLETDDTLKKGSSGRIIHFFTPNLEKSFHRGSSAYFLDGRKDDITSFNTQKSIGEKLGRVINLKNGKIEIETNKKISNGDGCCFFSNDNQLIGFKVNVANKNWITPAEKILIPKGTLIYRNFDREFEHTLSKISAERKIEISVKLEECKIGFRLTAIDEDGISLSIEKNSVKEIAKDAIKQRQNSINTLKKSGNTPFAVKEVVFTDDQTFFIPSSLIAEWRRELLAKLEEKRIAEHPRSVRHFPKTSHPYPHSEIDYKENIHNDHAKRFFIQHKSDVKEFSYERSKSNEIDLMTCKHCLKYSFGLCAKVSTKKDVYKEPFYLVSQSCEKFKLSFDCKECIMKLQTTSE